MSESLKPTPQFATEAEKRAFWESPGNDSTAYVDWSHARLATFPQLSGKSSSVSKEAAEKASPKS